VVVNIRENVKGKQREREGYIFAKFCGIITENTGIFRYRKVII
jgi:hypothetical protein